MLYNVVFVSAIQQHESYVYSLLNLLPTQDFILKGVGGENSSFLCIWCIIKIYCKLNTVRKITCYIQIFSCLFRENKISLLLLPLILLTFNTSFSLLVIHILAVSILLAACIWIQSHRTRKIKEIQINVKVI